MVVDGSGGGGVDDEEEAIQASKSLGEGGGEAENRERGQKELLRRLWWAWVGEISRPPPPDTHTHLRNSTES
jgi:hypothetical protein